MQLPRWKSTVTRTLWALASNEFLTSSTITPLKWVMDVEDLIFATTSGGRGWILGSVDDIRAVDDIWEIDRRQDEGFV